MAILAQVQEAGRWIKAGWTPVEFPEPPRDELLIGGGPVFLVNVARDLIFIDHEGRAFEIEPFLKEFVPVELREASISHSDVPSVSLDDKQGKFDF